MASCERSGEERRCCREGGTVAIVRCCVIFEGEEDGISFSRIEAPAGGGGRVGEGWGEVGGVCI